MDSPSFMTCVLIVNTQSRDWCNKLVDVLKGLQDVSYFIDAQQGIAYISGRVEPHKILRILENAGKNVKLSHVHYGNQTPGRSHNCCNLNLSPSRNYYVYDYDQYGYFPYGRHEYYDGNICGFDSDYRYHYQYGSPHFNSRRRQYYEPAPEQYAPISPVFGGNLEYGFDASGKVKDYSCCHIM